MFDLYDEYHEKIKDAVKKSIPNKGIEYEGSIFEEQSNHLADKINARIDTEIAVLTSQLDMMKEQQKENRESSKKADKLATVSMVVAIISLGFAVLTYFFG